jgi:hypothetical protein
MQPHLDRLLRKVRLQAILGQPVGDIDCRGAITIISLAKAE